MTCWWVGAFVMRWPGAWRRPITHPIHGQRGNETYSYGKRGLFIWQKRPMKSTRAGLTKHTYTLEHLFEASIAAQSTIRHVTKPFRHVRGSHLLFLHHAQMLPLPLGLLHPLCCWSTCGNGLCVQGGGGAGWGCSDRMQRGQGGSLNLRQ